MKKEVLVAIGIGFGLGLIITFGIWTANKSIKQFSSSKVTVSPLPALTSPAPSPTPDQTNNQLSISSPDDEALVNTDSVTLTGKSTPKAVIAITYEDAETITEADANGNFSTNVDLVGGYNTIVVTALDPATGTESSQTLTVTYTTAKI